MSPDQKIKIALDENRMSIMGVQILFGFQLQAPFHERFDTLPQTLKCLSLVAFALLSAAVALLIAPSAYHCIVTRAGAEGLLERGITWLINISLALLALAIGLDLYVVADRAIDGTAGLIFGFSFGLCAFLFWYGVELMHLLKRPGGTPAARTDTPPAGRPGDRISFVLTEARVVLPGAQALLGFQLAVVLTQAFGKLPALSAHVHVAALAAVALSTVLLIAPAAHHRIVYGGEDSEEFPPIAAAYLLGATFFLALGMAGDCYVIVAKVMGSELWGIASAAAIACLCFGLWHLLPLLARTRR